MKIFNAFSLQMLPELTAKVKFKEVQNVDTAINLLKNNTESYIGHADTANVISDMLSIKVPAERRFGKLAHGEVAVIAQVMGGRLPEGATTLPAGMEIKFVLVSVE